jgi:predicted nucleic acid-binding protein
VIRWLLDTNVISEIRKPRPDASVLRWMASVEVNQLHTSTLNIAEIRLGILKQQSAADAHALTLWLEHTVRPWFEDRIFEVTEAVLLRWRVLAVDLQRQRLPTPAPDLLIAAMALEHGLNIATRDTKPFVGTGVPIINPWTGQRFNGA